MTLRPYRSDRWIDRAYPRRSWKQLLHVPIDRTADPIRASPWTLGASSSKTFWRITLPAIRWGVAYGVVLTTARALGEYGAVAVVSGKIVGRTETLTVHIEESYHRFDPVAVYGSALVLASLAIGILGVMTVLGRSAAGDHHTRAGGH